MGLRDWLRRGGLRTETKITVTTKTTSSDGRVSDGSAEGAAGAARDEQQAAAIGEADHRAHELLATGSQASFGGVTVTWSADVVVNGRRVEADDAQVGEALRQAAAKLREQGFDELAGDLERRAASEPAPAGAAAGAAAPGSAGGAEAAPASALAPLPSPAADAPGLPAPAADVPGLSAPAVEAPAPAGFTGGDPGEAPSAPAAPSPPAPPS